MKQDVNGREFEETTAIQDMQNMARALKPSLMNDSEYVSIIKLVGLPDGGMLTKDEQIGLRSAIGKIFFHVYRLIKTDYRKDPSKALMIAVLATQIEDYFRGKPPLCYANAKEYIFQNDKESNEYVFGFNFVCTHIGLDPNKLRKAIKKTDGGWEKIVEKIRSL